MITRSIRYLLALTALVLPTLAYAEMKIAVVDQRRAILETVQGKELVKRMDAKLKPEVDQLKVLQADLQKIQQRLKADKDVLTDSEKDKISAEFEVKGREYQRHQQTAQEIQQSGSQELGEKFGARLNAALRSIGDSDKYDLILDSGSAPYVSASRDITKRVTEMLDRAK